MSLPLVSMLLALQTPTDLAAQPSATIHCDASGSPRKADTGARPGPNERAWVRFAAGCAGDPVLAVAGTKARVFECADGDGVCVEVDATATSARAGTVTFDLPPADAPRSSEKVDAARVVESAPAAAQPPPQTPAAAAGDQPTLRDAALAEAREHAKQHGSRRSVERLGLDGLSPPPLENFAVRAKYGPGARAGVVDHVYVFLRADGSSAGGGIPPIDENDHIHVYFVEAVEGLSSKCGVPLDSRVVGSVGNVRTEVVDPQKQTPPKPASIHAHACSADDGLELTWRHAVEGGSGKQTGTQTLDILPLYRLSVGAALVFDFTRTRSYDAELVEGRVVPQIHENNPRRGLGAVAFAAIRIARVDATRLRRASQWFAPAIGVSLRNPLDHLYLGLLIEPFPGIGAIAGYHFHREATLAGGYETGDAIASGAVPTKKTWSPQAEDWFVGVALDGRVLAELLVALGKKKKGAG